MNVQYVNDNEITSLLCFSPSIRFYLMWLGCFAFCLSSIMLCIWVHAYECIGKALSFYRIIKKTATTELYWRVPCTNGHTKNKKKRFLCYLFCFVLAVCALLRCTNVARFSLLLSPQSMKLDANVQAFFVTAAAAAAPMSAPICVCVWHDSLFNAAICRWMAFILNLCYKLFISIHVRYTLYGLGRTKTRGEHTKWEIYYIEKVKVESIIKSIKATVRRASEFCMLRTFAYSCARRTNHRQ